MASYLDITRKVLIDTVRIANEAHTWTEEEEKLPYGQKLAAVANSLNTDCELAKRLVSDALEDMVMFGIKNIGYLTKEFVKSTYSLISYYAAAPAAEKYPTQITFTAIEASKLNNIPEESVSRLTAYLNTARPGESTVAPFSLYEKCNLDLDAVVSEISSFTGVPLDELSAYLAPVEPNVLREKMEYYGHRPWVITPDLPAIVVEKIEPMPAGTC